MNISRRDFLKMSAGAIAGGIVGSGIGKYLVKNGYDKQIVGGLKETAELMKLSIEGQRRLYEVKSFRESLGLDGLPPEVMAGLVNPEHWDITAIGFTNLLPELSRSYGERIREIVTGLFGDNGSRNVLGAKRDQEYPEGMSFDPNTRMCNVSDSVHGIPIEDQFTDYVLHEAIGHGTDPGVGAKYPPEVLAQVEHGKWRALSQCLSIPEQFLNHPGDLMYPLLKKYVGESTARFMVGVDNAPISDLTSIPEIQSEVAKIAVKRGKNITSLKYNKAVCKEVGGMMIEKLRDGKIKFAGELKSTYQDTMEQVCVEIYAEMMKYALKYPDHISWNEDIVGGVYEIIRAISGNKEIEGATKVLFTPSPDVLSRNESEQKTIETLQQTEVATPTPPAVIETTPAITVELSPEEIEKAKREQEKYDEEENNFMMFSVTGTWPKTLVVEGGQHEIFREFALSYSAIANKYPMLKNTFVQQYNESFDPDLHFWEIRNIEQAMETGFVRNMLIKDHLSPEVVEEIKTRGDILKKFVDSPAF